MDQASKRLFPCSFCARVVKHSHLRGHLRAYSHSRIRRLRLKACRRARSITPSLTVSNTGGSSPSAARRQLRWRKAGYSCSYCMPHMSPYVSLEEPNHQSCNLSFNPAGHCQLGSKVQGKVGTVAHRFLANLQPYIRSSRKYPSRRMRK